MIAVNKRPRLPPPSLGRSIAWLADRRRDPTPINRRARFAIMGADFEWKITESLTRVFSPRYLPPLVPAEMLEAVQLTAPPTCR
jgi:hypothetical protein